MENRQLLKNCYMVMQDVNHQLFCETVEDEVQLGMRSENAEEVDRVLKQLDLSDLRDRHPMSLSGRQKQRVAIASAILDGKEILIFDEPTSGLERLCYGILFIFVAAIFTRLAFSAYLEKMSKFVKSCRNYVAFVHK